jgi:5-formyltetrahydrofolate cyclo-ligase
MSETPNEKKLLRRTAREHRDRIQPHPDYAESAAKNFTDHFLFDTQKSIALYMPSGSELDTFPLAEILWARGVVVLLPVTQDDERVLKFAKWQKDSHLQKNKFGIFEPVSDEFSMPDIILVPLLAFDQQGYRLGQGGGYYDATLADLRAKKDLIAVGYAYAEQAVLFALPREKHDQKLDFIVTPQRLFDFTAHSD